MGRVVQTVEPYAYPPAAHRRRHGPADYTDYASYRPWLEDEFSFRCVYCLKRMVWAPTGGWAVDHLIPQHEAPELECEYDNLVFACQFCNSQKGCKRVPDPCKVAYGACLRVEPDGRVTPLNAYGCRLVRVLSLNHSWQVAERLKTRKVLSMLARHDRTVFEEWMRYPADLPDLARKTPPRNTRPEGVAESHFARRQRGQLPATY